MKPCNDGFTPGYAWNGGKRKGPGRPSWWLDVILSNDGTSPESEASTKQGYDEDMSYPFTDSGCGPNTSDPCPDSGTRIQQAHEDVLLGLS